MRILHTRTLRGPNYWSIRRPKLIVVRLDLEELAESPSNTLPGFYDGLVQVLPSLEEHHCSPGCRGGFLRRVQEGTMMGHIVEHVALELQVLTGMTVGFGRTRETSTAGIYQVVVEYKNEAAGRYATRAAVRLCQSIIDTGSYPATELRTDLADLKELQANAALGATTDALVGEAEARGIPWMELENCDLFQLGYGKYQKRVQAALTSSSNVLGVELACDKGRTKAVLENMGAPVPAGALIYSFDDLEPTIENLGGYPIVIKPLDGNHGRGITIDIRSWQEAEEAYDRAKEISRGIIVERFYAGRDHRILVVNHQVVAVAERVPAHVVGNGAYTIAELVEQENQDERRGNGHDNVLTQIQLDDSTDEMLARQGLSVDTVLEMDQLAYLRATANLSTGGTAIDRTDDIHPDNVWLAERVSRIIDLDIAGIDVITTDITKPLKEADGVIVEVNAAPGLRMHLAPSEGVARNVAAPILQMLFPPDTPTHVPVVAVTGTNGKTTTTRLIAHIARQVHAAVGFTTTDGIYIGDHLIEKGDTTGPQSARMILQDPTVEMAVLETARGGILRSGLAFPHCDVGVVLNVAADHLGLGDIDTIDQMARVKGVIAEAVHADGYAILNADDERVAAMADRVAGKVAYFSMDAQNPLVQDHVRDGGIAAVYDDGHIVILQNEWVHRIEHVTKVPLTLGGRAPFMIANALAASLATFVQGITVEQIRAALRSFEASAQQTPGRMNLFNMGRFHALVDYAHNPAGYEAVGGFVKNWSGPTIGVVGGPGDRRDEDLIGLGQLAATFFDHIIVKEDDDRRGRPAGEASGLIVQGIGQVPDSAVSHFIQLDETTAIEWALDHAPEDALVVIFPEQVSRAIEIIQKRDPIVDDANPALLVDPADESSVEPMPVGS
ncbi:cyanophycin synthetase [Leptothoe kymatousa]|uniref:Cyanophycin synthetase n=1 Tax=Leptothoe kymatousa TAU-MAC 1615 TaxID=2364775 RepID=A0ABS5Y5M7_9CYAN|nr:cyanophycin synthetase [Leptothoe kymatousa]MBT9313164.1 cyanophycin synthetase [Leptothoe kymatousa TAU-MAC 1615]